jgi:hypothetical protein
MMLVWQIVQVEIILLVVIGYQLKLLLVVNEPKERLVYG